MMVFGAAREIVLLSLLLTGLLPRGSEAGKRDDVQPMPQSCVQYCHKAAPEGQDFEQDFEADCCTLTDDKRCGDRCPECPGPALNNPHCGVRGGGHPGLPSWPRLKCRLDASFMKEPKCLTFCQEQAQQKGRNLTAFYVYCGYREREGNRCYGDCPAECQKHCKGQSMFCPALPISPPAPPTTPKSDQAGKMDDNTKAAIVVAVVAITGLVLVAGAVWWLKFRKDGTVAPAA